MRNIHPHANTLMKRAHFPQINTAAGAFTLKFTVPFWGADESSVGESSCLLFLQRHFTLQKPLNLVRNTSRTDGGAKRQREVLPTAQKKKEREREKKKRKGKSGENAGTSVAPHRVTGNACCLINTTSEMASYFSEPQFDLPLGASWRCLPSRP